MREDEISSWYESLAVTNLTAFYGLCLSFFYVKCKYPFIIKEGPGIICGIMMLDIFSKDFWSRVQIIEIERGGDTRIWRLLFDQ